MNPLIALSSDEYSKYESLAYEHHEDLILDYSVQYHDGDVIYIRILKLDEELVGLVQTGIEPYTIQKNVGWKSRDNNAVELVCTAIAEHENEYVRSALANYGFAKTIEMASIDAKFDVPVIVLIKLVDDKSSVVRSSVAYHPHLPHASFAKLVGDVSPSVRAAAAESQNATRRDLEILSNDPDEIVRAEVASNPLTPSSALSRLSSDDSISVLTRLSENPSIPQDVVMKLAKTSSGEIKRNLAKNPAATQEVLDYLLEEAVSFETELCERNRQNGIRGLYSDSFHASLLRANVASNPNTSTEVLIELAKTAHQDSEELRLNLVNNPNTPQEAIEIIANNTIGTIVSTPDWPKALLDCPLLPVAYYKELAKTTSSTIRRLVRDNPRTPKLVRDLLSYDPKLNEKRDYYFGDEKRFPDSEEPMSIIELYSLSQKATDRSFAARALNASDEILYRLSLDYDPIVRTSVASNSYVNKDVLWALSHDSNNNVRCAVAENPQATMDIIDHLLQDQDDAVLSRLAKREGLPSTAYTQLSKSNSPAVRAAVARNACIPLELISTLIRDDSAEVRHSVAQREDISDADREHLFAGALNYFIQKGQDIGYGAEGEIVKILVNKVDLTNETLEFIANSKNRDVKANLAKRRDLPISLAEKLAHDKELSVRSELAQNPFTESTVLEILMQDENEYVRRYAIQNPNLSVEILRAKANSEDDWEKASAASNPKLPLHILVALSKSSSENVRELVAANTSTPEDVLLGLARDSSLPVRRSVARNTNAPVEAINLLVDEDDYSINYSLASRSDLPESVINLLSARSDYSRLGLKVISGECSEEEFLIQLESNKDIATMKSLASSESTPASVLEKLFDIGDDQIKRCLLDNPNTPHIVIKSNNDWSSSNGFSSFDEEIPF